MFSSSRFRRREVVLTLIIASVLVCTYAPLVRATYGFGDEFVLLLSEEDLEEPMFLADGRPVYALGHYFLHRSVKKVEQFGYLRLLAVAAVTLIALIFFSQFSRLGGVRLEHAALATALGTLPSLHTYVAQGYLAFGICAAVPVLLAAIIAFNATGDAPASRPLLDVQRVLNPKFLAVLLLMLLGSSTYQPMLSWYWPMIMVFLLDRRYLTSTDYRKRVYTTIAVGLICFALCFVAFKFYFLVFETRVKARTHLTSDPLGKLYWFLRIQLPLALNGWHLMDSSRRVLTLGIASISLLFIVAGYFACSYRYWCGNTETPRSSRRAILWQRALLIAGIVLLSHTHWLVLELSPQAYRVIPPLGVTVLVLAFWAFRQLSAVIKDGRHRVSLRRGLMIMLAFFAVWTCQHYSEKYWIAPHSTAYRYMIMTLRDEVDQDTNQIHVVRQGIGEGYVGEWFIECHGRPSSERDWSIEGMVQSAMRDSGVRHKVSEITHGTGSDPIPDEPGTVVIDMRKLKLFRIGN